MDGKRSDALSEAALDRELREALDVEPSPEFLARVRMRVAAEPPAIRTWTPARWLATAAAGALVAVAAIGVLRRADDGAPPTVSDVVTTGTPARIPSPQASFGGTPPEPRRVTRGSPRPVRLPNAGGVTPAHDPAPFPDVMISEEGARAFERLVRAAERGDLPEFPAEAEPIVIEPIEIEPLMLTTVSASPVTEGEGQP